MQRRSIVGKSLTIFLLGFAVVLGLASREARALVTVFDGNGMFPAFDAAAGNPPIAISLDALSGNIAGSTISGVTFSSPDSNTLNVVTAISTFTPVGFDGDTDNKLIATSGLNVLSPGGSSLDLTTGALAQKDSLRLVFSNLVSAFGIDLLYQSLDGVPFTSFQILNASNAVIASGSPVIPALPNGPDPTFGASAGGTHFIGFVSDAADIKQITFFETDDGFGNPDANIGYDTLRFVGPQQPCGVPGTPACPVPGPTSLLLVASGLAALGGVARRWLS